MRTVLARLENGQVAAEPAWVPWEGSRESFHLVIVGGGPAGLGPLYYAASVGELEVLLRKGVVILEKQELASQSFPKLKPLLKNASSLNIKNLAKQTASELVHPSNCPSAATPLALPLWTF